MSKLTLETVASGYLSTEVLNSNFEAIEAAFDNTVSRDGTLPNSMSANLDMNGQKVINARGADAASDVPTWGQVQALAFNYSVQRRYEDTTVAGVTDYSPTDFSYSPGNNNLAVYLDGVRLDSTEYTETSSTVVTLASDPGNGKTLLLVVNELLGTFGDVPSHTHSTADITDLASYTGLDARYYTEAEVTALLAAKANLAGAAFTGNISTTGTFSRKNADSSTLTTQPRIFVQAGDPGAAAADGDIWIW